MSGKREESLNSSTPLVSWPIALDLLNLELIKTYYITREANQTKAHKEWGGV